MKEYKQVEKYILIDRDERKVRIEQFDSYKDAEAFKNSTYNFSNYKIEKI